LENLLGIELVRWALLDLAPGQMADAIDQRVLDGADDSLGHLRSAHPERRVDRGHDPVELGEHIVVVVELAVGEDVDLAPGEQLDPVHGRVADLVDLAAQHLRR
jgi:hypothetical protein